MLEAGIIIGVIVIYIIYNIKKESNFSFWGKVGKYPEIAFMEMMMDDAWCLEENRQDNVEYDGAFRLFVPSVGFVKIYGEIGKYEDSQKSIEQKLDLLINADK